MSENEKNNSELSSFLDVLSPLRKKNNSSTSSENDLTHTDTPDENKDKDDFYDN
eukprot:jgi/Orpsp1_1/1174222/evm.model.c7180000049320.1